ncbi:MAG: BamA/TamA family outer membrane protein, partial [bacterium]
SGLGLVGGKRISILDYTRLYLQYNLEKRDIRPVEDKASDFVQNQAGKRTTSRVTLKALRSSVDSPFFPRMGSRTSLELEWAGTILGGDVSYQSYIFDHRSFIGLPILKSALVFGLRTGVVDKLGSKGYVPIYERFRLGGTTLDGVRGYDDREIIPEGNAIDQGGRFMLINVLEWRVPVVENRAHVLAFFDAGNTWNSLRAARPSLLRKSVGIGFRIEIPMMGQLGIDVGYGFDREDRYGGPGWQTHFQFGMAGY